MLKSSLVILFFLISLQSFAQVDSLIDSFINRRIPPKQIQAKNLINVRDSQIKNESGSVFINDSAQKLVDTLLVNTDSLIKDSGLKEINIAHAHAVNIIPWKEDSAFTKMFQLSFSTGKGAPVFRIEEQRIPHSKDQLFYLLVGITALLAFIKISFPGYFQNIFRLFLQASYRQKQSRENLMQDNLPSLLLNLFFIFSCGLFVALVAINRGWINIQFWLLYSYCAALLASIYIIKFLFISFAGWVFRAQQAAGSYIFIVFLINKVIGLVLVPLLLLLAFSTGELASTLITVAASSCVLLLLYRYIMLLTFVRKNLKVSPMHFFIYLCTVEIIPMLVIYKVLFNKIGSSI